MNAYTGIARGQSITRPRTDRTKFPAFSAHSTERVSAGKSQLGRYGSCQIQSTKQMPQTSTLPMTAAKTMRVYLCTLEPLEMSCRDVLDGRISVKF